MRRSAWVWLWTAAAMAQVQPAPPAMAPGKGSVEGTITDPVSHEPVKKAQVMLSGPAPPPLTAITDAGGRFAFHQLPAGGYWLSASKPGYNPQSLLGAEPGTGVVLGEGEERKDVAIALARGGSLTGRVTNEEGAGVRGCTVTAVQPGYEQSRRAFKSMGGGMTSEDGGYRIQDLAPGRYHVFAQCNALLPAPHVLLRRDDPRTPHETYLPQFYGGGLDPATATRITLGGGASLDSIDFRVTRVAAFTVRGSVTGGDREALTGGVNMWLQPANRLLQGLVEGHAQADAQKGTFEIPAVIPGSYVLYAFSAREGRNFAGQRKVEVGAAMPDPVDIPLAGGADLKGSVQFDGDDHPPIENGQITLSSADRPFFMPQPQAPIGKDGGFLLTGVLPGHWHLNLNTAGYVKSVSLGGQPVSPYAFEVAAGTQGPLEIVLGTKTATVAVSIAGAAQDGQVSVLIFPDAVDSRGAGQERMGTAAGAVPVEFGALPPGRYRVLATDVQSPWPLLQRPDLLKSLESRTAVIEVQEGGRATTTVEITPRDELMRAQEEQE